MFNALSPGTAISRRCRAEDWHLLGVQVVKGPLGERYGQGVRPRFSRSSQESDWEDRLVGLVVKASASRAEGPGFESRLRRDFFGSESYQ